MAQLPIATLLTTRLTEYDPTFELRPGTGFESLFFEPLQFIVQPLRDEANTIATNQSLLLILLQGNVDSYDPTAVDALVSNLYVVRQQGELAAGVARVYYNDPQDNEYPQGGAVFTGTNGLTYANSAPFIITEAQMSSQIDTNGLYYMDVPITATATGDTYNLPIDGIVSLAGDLNYVSTTNLAAIADGLDTETNTALITRTQNSIGVRDLVTGNGFSAILFENFSASLQAVQPVGFGDPEMMRDIVYNTHIGGRVDGYAQGPVLQEGSANFVGLLLDETRQTFTSSNVLVVGTAPASLGNPNIDNANGLVPIVQEIALSTSASYTNPTAFSAPIDLSVKQYVKIGIDGTFMNIRVAGVSPGATNLNEVVSLINGAFGENVAFATNGKISIQSQTSGLTSQVVLATPDFGATASALDPVFALLDSGSPYTYDGEGPTTYIEGVNFTIDYEAGTIQRIVGPPVVASRSTGQILADQDSFTDSTSNIFLSVDVNDILTIGGSTPYSGDYRILEVTNANTLVIDAIPAVVPAANTGQALNHSTTFFDATTGIFADVEDGDKLIITSGPNTGTYTISDVVTDNTLTLTAALTVTESNIAYFITRTATSVPYSITRTGIKSGQLIYAQYYFNPLSIDIGNMILLGPYGSPRGIRPGRTAETITDLAMVRITQIQVIDPNTLEPTGQVLSGAQGYGRGGYGRGGYGVGAGGQWYLVVNAPTARFSMFEDSYIVLDNGLQGLSFQVSYEFAPEISTFHNFVTSDGNRVLDGDILMKHFLPAYVSGTIQYSASATNPNLPTTAVLQAALNAFIMKTTIGQPLIYSDISQFILTQIDPTTTYTANVLPFTLQATIHNADGTTTIVTGASQLTVPTPSPAPTFTTAPISPRIASWIPDTVVNPLTLVQIP